VGSWAQRAFFIFSKLLATAFVKVFFRLRAYDVANVPKQGGAIILSNHESFLDPMLVGCPVRRPLCFMARDTLFRNPILGWILRWVNAFPVKRGRADRAAMRTALERLSAGDVLVMFPEGTRTPNGELQPVKGGFRFLVRKANVAVVPVVLDGAFTAWPRSRKLPRPGRVGVIYGQAIPPEEFENLSDAEAAERIQREMDALLGDLRRKRAITCHGSEARL
jgi:1-acyl-sn-glycerol-3-phosphate acyltransferase